jgi:signal transduction histidine kinase
MDLARLRGRLGFGLQARMTASYVLVTAVAVVVVEAIAIGVVIPSYLAGQDLTNRVLFTAGSEAESVGVASLSTTSIVLPDNFTLGDAAVQVGPGSVQYQGQGVLVPQVDQALPDGSAPSTVAMLVSNDGIVLASSYPAVFPVGANASKLMPLGDKSLALGFKGQISDVRGGRVAWAVQPVMVQLSKSRGVAKPDVAKGSSRDGWVYVQAPFQALSFPTSFTAVQPWLQAGLAVLLLALPVGALFGLLTTRGTVRRLKDLAGSTALVADGDFSRRVRPGTADEVGSLERNFNEMAGRLETAIGRERSLADMSARQAERNRISRELHDSISQDLFSINLLAAGIEEALPGDSPLRREARALRDAAEATNREMRALLMELRPAALEERGLVPALEELASTYALRFGVEVDARLDPVAMSPAAELAALRIAQEGLANAVKHARATTMRLELHRADGHALIIVSDDGQGFDAGANGSVGRLGLRLMRERVEELKGTLKITSAPGQGTVIEAALPAGAE